MQRDVENPLAAAEPGGQSAELEVLFGEKDGAAGSGEDVGGGHAPQPPADHDHVVPVSNVCQWIAGHYGL